MKAIVLREFGPLGSATLEDWPPPECGAQRDLHPSRGRGR